MEGIGYKGGHKLPKELIINTLESIGCRDIKDNDYGRTSENTTFFREKKENMIPDFVCNLNGRNCAVEIGNLSCYGGENRISKLLNEWKYVIHIFADKTYYLLHCILYEGKVKINEKFKDFLLKQRGLMDDLISDNEEDEVI